MLRCADTVHLVRLPPLSEAMGTDFDSDEPYLLYEYEIRKILLEAGADPMLCTPEYSDSYRWPAMHWAIHVKVTVCLRSLAFVVCSDHYRTP